MPRYPPITATDRRRVADDRRDTSWPRPQPWFGRLARAAAGTDRQDGDGPPKLLSRVTRAQKIIAGASAAGVLIALIVAAPALPWPLSYVQQFFAIAGLRADAGPDAYLLPAVILLWMLVMLGATWLWLVVSWRLARFPLAILGGALAAGAVACSYFGSTPGRALFGWVAVAVLSIAYIHYYRKGRFGYTRGTAAAIFSHLALLCFFVALPFVLIAILR
jgi:hypothetical protein